VLRELAEIPSEDVGPDREPKYLFAGFQAASDGLDVVLAPTTWRLGKSFHNAVRNHPGRFLRADRSWLVPTPLGPARLPGLAVVHGIVLTSDGRVLLAQRSETLAYAPLHWSISFEEQITAGDLRGGDRVLHLAASRGLVEEFGVAADPARIHLLSALLEMDNLNLAAVVLIETAETLDGIRERWSGELRPTHAWEARARRHRGRPGLAGGAGRGRRQLLGASPPYLADALCPPRPLAARLSHLLRRDWKGAPAITTDTVRVHVGSLRRKLEPDPANPRYIGTEPWVGYRFLAEPAED
jgi:hypothetical protein